MPAKGNQLNHRRAGSIGGNVSDPTTDRLSLKRGNVSPESRASSNSGTPGSILYASILCMVFLLLGMTFLL